MGNSTSLNIVPYHGVGLQIIPFGYDADVIITAGTPAASTTEEVYLGSTALTAVNVGSTQVTAIYIGSTLVWGS